VYPQKPKKIAVYAPYPEGARYRASTSLQLESFLIVKSGTTFMAMAMKSPGSSLETEMEFFKDNISFGSN